MKPLEILSTIVYDVCVVVTTEIWIDHNSIIHNSLF